MGTFWSQRDDRKAGQVNLAYTHTQTHPEKPDIVDDDKCHHHFGDNKINVTWRHFPIKGNAIKGTVNFYWDDDGGPQAIRILG